MIMRFLAAALAVAGLWAQPVAAQGIPKSVLPTICGTSTLTSVSVCINDGNGVAVQIGTLNPIAHTYAPVGTPPTLNFGTASGTVTQGNDPRVTGALEAVNALSELMTVSSAARLNIGAAARGVNGDITALTALTTPISVAQGGTGGASLSAAFDSAYGSTQGSLLYRGATAWLSLVPGTTGQLLASGGTGASPTWQTVAGSGSVTSVSLAAPSDETVTGSPISTSGTLTIARNAQAPNSVLAGPATGTSTGVPIYRALVPADEPAAADGCVQLTMSSNVLLKLSPKGCNTLWIGGVPTIVTPITVSNSALSVNTTYYVYDTVSGLATVATGHVTGADGREYINNGGVANTTGRLVGMVRTDSSGNFTAVASYFNRSDLVFGGAAFTTGVAQTNPLILISYGSLIWADNAGFMSIEGFINPNTTGGSYTNLTVDGNNVGATQNSILQGSGYSVPVSLSFPWKGAEGWHTFAATGATNSGGVGAVWTATLTIATRG